MRGRRLLVALVLAGSVGHGFPERARAIGEEEVPHGDRIESIARDLEALIGLDSIDVFTRPIRRGELARAVVRARGRTAAVPGSLADAYLWELEEELAPELTALAAAGGPGARTSPAQPPGARTLAARGELTVVADRHARWRPTLTASAAVRAHPRVSWQQRIEVDRDGLGDPDFLGEEWKEGISGRFTHAVLAIDLDVVRVFVGRRNPAWGVGLDGNSLILQGDSPPFDQIGAEASLGPLDLHAFTGPLDALSFPDSAGGAGAGFVTADRWLAAHRIAFSIRDRVRIGLTETMLYGGPGRGLDWGYANPLLLSYAVQWNRDRNDNPFWSVDVHARATRWLDLHAEFLIDDFQYEDENEPHQIGFLAGFRLKNVPGASRAILDIEYARLNSLVYVHAEPWNRYTYGNAALGSPLGPDGDRLRARMTVRPCRGIEGILEVDHTRNGSRAITDPFGDPGDFGGAFLVGAVTEVTSGRIRVTWIPSTKRRLFGEYSRTEDEWTARGGATMRLAKTWEGLFD